jgi:hypothetical protein
VLCSSKLESWRHNTVYCTPAVARRLGLRVARDSRALGRARSGAPVRGAPRGPRERCQSFRRLRFCRRHVASSSAMTGSATRVSENLTRQQRPRSRVPSARVVVLRGVLVRARHRDREPYPDFVTVSGPGAVCCHCRCRWFSVAPRSVPDTVPVTANRDRFPWSRRDPRCLLTLFLTLPLSLDLFSGSPACRRGIGDTLLFCGDSGSRQRQRQQAAAQPAR